MKKIFNSKILLSVLSLVLIAAMALSFSACSNNDGNNTTTTTESTTNAVEKTFTFIAVDIDGTEKTFTVTSDADNLADALLDEGLITGTEGDYGLMVESVDGITHTYEGDGIYWALYVGDEMSMVGASSVEITDGAEYSFVATK